MGSCPVSRLHLKGFPEQPGNYWLQNWHLYRQVKGNGNTEITTALNDCSERVINRFYTDKGNPLDTIYLNLQEASDSHQTLTEAKLSWNTKEVLKCIKKLVRKIINDTQIPPESVLGPILFNKFQTICNSNWIMRKWNLLKLSHLAVWKQGLVVKNWGETSLCSNCSSRLTSM